MRISLRYKLLAVMSLLLFVALGMYLWLATTLVTRDKLAYVYDLNSAQTQVLSEQTATAFELLRRELDLVRRETKPETIAVLFAELARADAELVRLELVTSGAERRTLASYISAPALRETQLTAEDLARVRKESPIPVDLLADTPGAVFAVNSSLPPDVPLITYAYRLDAGRVLLADFMPKRLLRLFSRSKLGETFLVDGRGVVLAHADLAVMTDRKSFGEHPLVKDALHSPLEQATREVELEDGTPVLGAYTRVSLMADGRRGIDDLFVVAQTPKALAFSAARALVEKSLLFGLAILFAAIIVSVLFARLLTGSLRKLRNATERVGKGDLDLTTGVRSRDEIGELAKSFESMTRQLKTAQAALVQSEKMAAFGQLGAGITHEIKNPMTGIIGFAQIAQKKASDPEKVVELLKMIESEGLRCRDILVNFLKFARTGARESHPLEVNEFVRDAAKIFTHQLQMNRVKVVLELGENVPHVSGSAPELQQVLLNLAMNAQQAMKGGGQVTLRTRTKSDTVEIEVTDNGPGMPPEVRDRIFEPFFTTKPPGEGTGLGLSVSYGIVRDHHGTISVTSEPGKGTSFFIRLPAQGILDADSFVEAR